MSVRYVPVQWTGHKRVYDSIIASGVVAYLAIFIGLGKLFFRGAEAVSDPILLMRAFGSCALLMLHVILCIGPLARLDRRFLPLLYNRRHLGVATFGVGLLHATLVIGFYHGFGVVSPLVSLLTSNTNYFSLRAFPFEVLGLVALLILFLMASTSHDFWNRNLGPRVWKGLHMLVYPAYALLVLHVALGALQARRSVVLPVLLCAGAATVLTLHVIAGLREVRRDRQSAKAASAGLSEAESWVDVASVDEINENRGKAITMNGLERIAIFRYGGCISAITNVCAHQGGPLGEGKIIDGCVTCPWHGWQYRPADGCAPPPFSEKVATYRVRVEHGRVFVDPRPLAPGTPVDPARCKES